MIVNLDIRPAGDAAVLVRLGTRIDFTVNCQVRLLAAKIQRQFSHVAAVEVIPAYVSLLVRFNPLDLDYEAVSGAIREAASGNAERLPVARRFNLPVCYGDVYGPDLIEVARYHDLDAGEVIRRHTHPDYPIYCLGFSPGFPFLGGLDESLHTPRLETPRPQVPSGSVAIGGSQTGIYPTSTPGGWRLIGRTPLRLFDIRGEPPVVYSPGDIIRFEAIDAAEFGQLQAQERMPEAQPIHDQVQSGDTRTVDQPAAEQ
jgi:inhibitor of KinA